MISRSVMLEPGYPMNHFLKSANRLCWALSLLGVEAALAETRTLFPVNRLMLLSPQARADGSAGSLWEALAARRIMRTGIEFARHSARCFAGVAPWKSWQIAAWEIQNKLYAFSLFEQVDLELGSNLRLPAMVAKASQLDVYSAVWATEGAGHYYAVSRLSEGDTILQISLAVRATDLPLASLTPLHAGVGLALAESVLRAVDEDKTARARDTLASFLQECTSSFEAGYREIVYEALGLVTRNLYPHLISEIAHSFGTLNPELDQFFWHGFGRGAYFAPSSFSPGNKAGWRGMQTHLKGIRTLQNRRNAIAGFTWALALVNIKQPEILAAFLENHRTELDEDALYNGLLSGLVVWMKSSSRDDGYVRRLLRYGLPHNNRRSRTWEWIAVRACENAIAYCNRHAATHGPGELFRYQPS